MPDSDHTSQETNWLERYLETAIRNNVCVRIRCTTCGAEDFRLGLLGEYARATGKVASTVITFARLNHDTAIDLAQALALVRPSKTDRKFFDAVRFVLFDVRYFIGGPWAEQELERILGHSYAGDVLERMKAHYNETQRARTAREDYQSPERVQQRREEKRRMNQQQHAERMERKKEKDRLWREEQAGTDS